VAVEKCKALLSTQTHSHTDTQTGGEGMGGVKSSGVGWSAVERLRVQQSGGVEWSVGKWSEAIALEWIRVERREQSG
jgi:hypothetical protein